MDEATYERMPKSIEVREVLVQVNQPGFRTESLVVVTTLCDAEEYTSREIAELYRGRWHVEVYQPEYASSAGLYRLAA
jgi:hypothetical protein